MMVTSAESVLALVEATGADVFGERRHTLRAEIEQAGTGTVRVDEVAGVAARVERPRGEVEVSLAASELDSHTRRQLQALTARLAPGRYAFSGVPGRGPNADGAPFGEASELLESMRHVLRLAGVPQGLRLRMIVERTRRTVTIAGQSQPLVTKDEAWSRASCFVIDPTGADLGKASLIDAATQAGWPAAASLAAVIAEASRQARRLVAAAPPPPGRYPVVFAPRSAGTIVHELIGHALEGDNAVRHQGPVPLAPGSRLASEAVSVVHDATTAFPWGGADCDDEGTPTQRIPIVEGGVVLRHLTDRRHARATGQQPLGHGRRVGYDFPVLPRISTLILEPAGTDPGDLADELPSGLVVHDIGGAAIDVCTGRCMVRIREAEVVEGGQTLRVSRGGTIRCDLVDALAAIDAVGADGSLRPTLCMKGGQLLPTGSWAPSLRIKDLEVR